MHALVHLDVIQDAPNLRKDWRTKGLGARLSPCPSNCPARARSSHVSKCSPTVWKARARIRHMQRPWRLSMWWVAGGAAIALAGAAAIARQSLEQQRALFETDARIVHRLLSQQVVQHDAILATLALLQPAPDAPGSRSPEQRLPALYPRILSVQRSDATTPWPDPGLAEAERLSRQSGRAALAPLNLSGGRYRLVLASEPASYALTIDLQALVPWSEWPMAPQTSAVRVELVQAGQRHLVQPGRLQAGAGARFEFHKVVAAESQSFDVVATQTVGWRQWPWARMVAWVLAVVALLAALQHLQRQRLARRRAEELLRLGTVGTECPMVRPELLEERGSRGRRRHARVVRGGIGGRSITAARGATDEQCDVRMPENRALSHGRTSWLDTKVTHARMAHRSVRPLSNDHAERHANL